MSVAGISEDELLLILSYNQENSRVRCPECNVDVLYYDVYCHHCGVKLDLEGNDSRPDENVTTDNCDEDIVLLYAGVNLLNRLNFDPLFEGDESFYAPFSPLTNYDVVSYLVDKGFIDVLIGEEKVDVALSHIPRELLEYILKQRTDDISSSVEDNIKLMYDNFSLDELEAMLPRCYVLTSAGEDILKSHVHCLIYHGVFYDYDIVYYDDKFSNSADMNQFLIDLVDDSIEDSFMLLQWQSYSELLFKYAEVYDILGDYDKMMYYAVGHFICEFSLFADNRVKDFISIDISMKNKVKYTLARAAKGYDDFLAVVGDVYDNLRIPRIYISRDEVSVLIEELFDDNIKLRQVNNHFVKLYGQERINLGDMTFTDEDEQEKIVEELDKLFN